MRICGKEQTMSNQTVKADAGKPKVSLVPPEIVYDIARIREYGNNKYPEGGKDNWKEVEPESDAQSQATEFTSQINLEESAINLNNKKISVVEKSNSVLSCF